jgi:hypothetical protein
LACQSKENQETIIRQNIVWKKVTNILYYAEDTVKNINGSRRVFILQEVNDDYGASGINHIISDFEIDCKHNSYIIHSAKAFNFWNIEKETYKDPFQTRHLIKKDTHIYFLKEKICKRWWEIWKR